MNELVGVARFTFHEGKLEEVRRLQDDIYLNDDAHLAHLARIGDDLVEAILATVNSAVR